MSEQDDVTRQQAQSELILAGWRPPKGRDELSEKQLVWGLLVVAALTFWWGWSWGADNTREEDRELYCHTIHAVESTMPPELRDQVYMLVEDRYQEVLLDCSSF